MATLVPGSSMERGHDANFRWGYDLASLAGKIQTTLIVPSARIAPRARYAMQDGGEPGQWARDETSAVPAGRELARVHRLLQELLGVVLPELADVRVRVDDR